MADEAKPKFKLKLEWLWAPLLVMVAYVLSVGPACKLESMGLVSDEVIETVYGPLEILARTEMGREALHWYIFELWQRSVRID